GIGRTSPMFGSLTLAFGLLCSRPLCLGFRTRWSFLSPCSSLNSPVYSHSASLRSPPLIQRREVPAEIFRSPRCLMVHHQPASCSRCRICTFFCLCRCAWTCLNMIHRQTSPGPHQDHLSLSILCASTLHTCHMLTFSRHHRLWFHRCNLPSSSLCPSPSAIAPTCTHLPSTFHELEQNHLGLAGN
ncbi:hypothetical protein MUK42_14347, partial [Musa troglodytarum]